jgi:hypothetical protein
VRARAAVRSPVFLPYVAFVVFRRFRFARSSVIRFVQAGAVPAHYPRREMKTMTIIVINKATRREQQQNGPCPFIVDCPPEPRK